MKIQTVITLLILFMFCCQGSEESPPEQSETDIVSAMDEYHHLLRPLMHQALPDEEIAAFKENAQALVERAQQISTAQVPEKLKNDKDKISELADSLLIKTRSFSETCKSGSEAEILETFRTAHDEYEALADIVYGMRTHEAGNMEEKHRELTQRQQ